MVAWQILQAQIVSSKSLLSSAGKILPQIVKPPRRGGTRANRQDSAPAAVSQEVRIIETMLEILK